MKDSLKKFFYSKNIQWFFLANFIFIGSYLKYEILNASISPHHYNKNIIPHFGKSPWEILFSDYHSYIQIYRNSFSGFLYNLFGFNHLTYRIFPLVVSLLTLIYLYAFVVKEIRNYQVAILTVLLFSISHYSLLSILVPYYGGFYMLASFMTFICLWKALHGGGLWSWIGFGVWNFLNVTNIPLGGFFVVPVMVVGGWYFYQQWSKEKIFTEEIKDKEKYFAISLAISTAMIVLLYHVRGLNILGEIFNAIFLNNNFEGANQLVIGKRSSAHVFRNGFWSPQN